MAVQYDYSTCNPFRAWNRLEPRTRTDEFGNALRAEVHDPLWMLTRQWQFGEFKGEDTGSAILAKLQVETTQISRLQLGQEAPTGYSDQVPLETMVESERRVFDYRSRVLAGQRWMKLVSHYGQEFNNTTPAIPFDEALYRKQYLGLFPIEVPEIADSEKGTITEIQKAQQLTNAGLKQFINAVSGKAIDGIAIFFKIEADPLVTVLNTLALDSTHQDFIKTVLIDFQIWCEKKFALSSSKNTAWNNQQLEYQFACGLPEKSGRNTVLAASEYYHDKLDWYAFEVDTDVASTSGLLNVTDQERKELIETNNIALIPTPLEFGGMPNARWWEFEDGDVNLANIKVGKTDIAKILMTEFALVYSNDWLIVPYGLPVGSLSKVNGIVVTDVFGQKTFVTAANQGEADDWSSWGMFNLSLKENDSTRVLATDTRMFMPPTPAKIQDSEPLEVIHFVRDEMANLVWAIEVKVQDLLGRGMDGHAAAVELTNFINGETEPLPEVAENALLQYILTNTVPENWIPFMAIHTGNDNRSIQLQRASMPRVVKDEDKNQEYLAVRPRTELLRVNLPKDYQQDTAPFINASRDTPTGPWLLHEEEVPKAGIRLFSTNQRTRWYDGKIFNWYGHKKTIGRGEGSSGLFFDKVVQLKKQAEG